LDPKEILNALASSAVLENNAHRCLKALNKMRGCEMHTTHLMTRALRQREDSKPDGPSPDNRC